jgi:hypothetical protein
MRPTTRLSLLLCPLLIGCVPQTPDRVPPGPDTECEEPAAVEKDLLIEKAEDFDDADLPKGCWDLYGTLTFSGDAITSLKDFDRLEDLAGVNHLIITNTKLKTIDAPESIYVYGRVEATDNDLLTSLKNITVDKDEALDVIVENNAVLVDFGTLTELTKIGGVDEGGNASGGYLRVTDNPKLTTAEFSRLKSVATSVMFRNNGALTTIELPRVEYVRDLMISTNAKLTTVGAMSSLTQILGNVTVQDNDALTSLGLFASGMQFVTGSVTIKDNAAVTSLGQLSHLSGIGSININSNPALPACLAQEVSVCVPQHSSVAISNNNGTATNCDYWCN